ncbi:hypothetical protein SDC9_179896 [bioreactor metagenome]|uniref:Uncharacterized protein n=1 Tax=bioreactor metagenome TaxID=1076179 RepID=A0A645H0A7_9ZZZZ
MHKGVPDGLRTFRYVVSETVKLFPGEFTRTRHSLLETLSEGLSVLDGGRGGLSESCAERFSICAHFAEAVACVVARVAEIRAHTNGGGPCFVRRSCA